MKSKPDKDLKAQGERLKQIREHFKFGTQEDFGIELGKRVNKNHTPIDFSTIAKYERGAMQVSNKVLLELFTNWNVNKEWFYTGNGLMLTTDTDDGSQSTESVLQQLKSMAMKAVRKIMKDDETEALTTEVTKQSNELLQSIERLEETIKKRKNTSGDNKKNN